MKESEAVVSCSQRVYEHASLTEKSHQAEELVHAIAWVEVTGVIVAH